MIELDKLKKEIDTASQLRNIAQASEQAAALYIVRTREKVLGSRSYFEQIWKTYDVVRKLNITDQSNKSGGIIVTITPNKGMYGDLVNKVVLKSQEIVKKGKYDWVVAGKKGKSSPYLNDRKFQYFEYSDVFSNEEIAKLIDITSKYAEVIVVYPKYNAAFDQSINVIKLGDVNKKDETVEDNAVKTKQYVIDPDIAKIDMYFDKKLQSIILYKYFIEAMLAFKASQMIVMKRAYDNADEMFKESTKKYFIAKREMVDSKLREISAGRMMWEGNGE